MSNLKRGDICLIINATIESNIGKTCELIEFLPPGACYRYGRALLPNGDDVGRWVCGGDGVVSAWHMSVGLIPANWLMPLRGNFQPEQEKAKEVEA